MADRVLSGRKGFMFDFREETLVEGDGITELLPNKWYKIDAKASTGSTLPDKMVVTQIFKTPDVASTAIIPAVGDNVYPLNSDNYCHVDINMSFEEGTIDVTTKCSDDFVEMILDGFVSFSGDVSGFISVDSVTGAMTTSSEEIFNRFMDIVDDDSEGGYVITERDNKIFNLALCFNSDAEIGQIQNWVLAPVLLTSFGTGAPLKDAVKSAVNFTKAQGKASKYNRVVKADDVIGEL